MSSETDPSRQESVVVTVKEEIITENGAFETLRADDYTERTSCMVFFDTTVSEGTIRVQKDNIRSVVYL